MRIAVVAGEASGDILGAALIRALRERFPHASFYGVTGPRMREAGCETLEGIEALSVMGLTEVLRHLPRLFGLRARLERRFLADRPDLFVGVDAPDFNLGLERRLRARGLRTAHLVSPTVWAWRPGRVKTVARAVDLILCMYPFEPRFYAGQPVRAAYIGHPLADELDDSVTAASARRGLGLPEDARIVALLPGSRRGELRQLADAFVGAAARLAGRAPDLQFVIPVAEPAFRPHIEAAIARHGANLRWHLLDGKSREAMRAADVVLLASGTATLECLLVGRPMVVAYRTSPVTAWLLRELGLLKIDYVSQPNLLTANPVVPELLQRDATPDRLADAVGQLLERADLREQQLREFQAVRRELRRDAGARAADAIAEMLR